MSGHIEPDCAHAIARSTVVVRSASSIDSSSCSKTLGPRSGQSVRSVRSPAFAAGRSEMSGQLTG